MFLKQQISILERFLKDCVTLKTGAMPAENSALLHSNKLKYIQIENSYYCITVFTVFLIINAALVIIRDLF